VGSLVLLFVPALTTEVLGEPAAPVLSPVVSAARTVAVVPESWLPSEPAHAVRLGLGTATWR